MLRNTFPASNNDAAVMPEDAQAELNAWLDRIDAATADDLDAHWAHEQSLRARENELGLEIDALTTATLDLAMAMGQLFGPACR